MEVGTYVNVVQPTVEAKRTEKCRQTSEEVMGSNKIGNSRIGLFLEAKKKSK